MKYQRLKTKNGGYFTFRTILKVIAGSGLGWFCIAYLVFFFICAGFIFLDNPDFRHYGDAVWLCFQSITTIGFGDMDTSHDITRAIIIILGIVSLFFLAIITGVVVAYINQLISLRLDNSEMAVLHKLEHLDKMSKEELKELSNSIKKRKNNKSGSK